MVIKFNQASRPGRARETAALMTELMIGMAILGIAVFPLAYSFAQEHKYLRTCYQRAVAMEIVDGEMEVLLAGEWHGYTNGVHTLAPRAQAATNLHNGILQLTVNSNHLRVEWLPADKNQGGKIVREAKAK
jgi:hypothetical protein